MLILVGILIGFATLLLIWYHKQRTKLAALSHFPGPKPHLILGNGDIFDNKDAAEIFQIYLELHRTYGPDLVTYGLFCEAMLQISSAAALEKILPPKVTKKDYMYGFLESWLGTGLITSGGEKWFHRRKILTPSFHFKILDQFLDVFNEESDKLVRKLQPHARDGKDFDIHNYIALHALNGLCATLRQINSVVNENGRMLDLCFANDGSRIPTIELAPTPLVKAVPHHPALSALLEVTKLNARVVNLPVFYLDYKNFKDISRILATIDYASELDLSDPNSAAETFLHILNYVMDRHVPKRTIRENLRTSWVTTELRRLKTEKRHQV
ncbi:cytochrome P450 4c3-like [Uranotaenia lowii]|uniref:cytochrome P450 4c3-like n=1 Tax=Uranotaenia lowii TaxID=190385 RepID=UPI0024793139|nr:cytochrome P450 4c3-like [Uranotaenia lowii]